MNDLTYLLYSHSSYSDILYIHLNEIKKYLPNINIKIAFNNYQIFNEKFGEHNYDIIEYDDKEPYFKKLSKILKNIKTKYVLLQHENNILFDFPKENILEKTISFMDINTIDQVRLLQAGIDESIIKNKIFNKINEGYFFSVITAIWKKSCLEDITLKFQELDYKYSENYEVQNYVKNFKNYFISSDKDILLKDQAHVISYYFPTIHVTRNGKWITKKEDDQQHILDKLLKDYNIDQNKRGIFSY